MKQIEFPNGFNSNYIAHDYENERMFISTDNKIHIYNISEPINPVLVGEINEKSQAVMEYHDEHLFFVNFTLYGQILKVYQIGEDNSATFIGESEPFDWATEEDEAIELMYFPKEGLMITCNPFLRFWDISDLSNITCLSCFEYDTLLRGADLGVKVECSGIAFHPEEEMFLISINYSITGEIYLVDYSNPVNPVVVDIDLTEFNENESTIRVTTKYGLISNEYNPCFISGLILELFNWENASKPKFGVKYRLPSYNVFGIYPNLILYEKDELLIYNVLSGLVNVSDLSAIKYDTECNTSKSLYFLQRPIINNNYIYSLERERIWDEGVYYYLSIRQVKSYTNNIETQKSLWALSSLLIVPIVVIPIIIKKKR
ncbi:MAG: hypothetical protein FK731_11655 [Asgard group archaeon]|nr:hypothetical protein [Asgard group archaeon]